MKRWPALDADGEAAIEIRQVFEADDFGDAFTPELREAEERMREQIANPPRPRPPVTPYLERRRRERDDRLLRERLRRRPSASACPAEDGKKVMHAELEIAGGTIFLSDMGPPREPSGVSIALGLENAKAVDALAARLDAHGATINHGPADMFWGDRFAEVTDPFGHQWMLTAPKD